MSASVPPGWPDSIAEPCTLTYTDRSSKYHKVEKRYREAKIKCDTTQMAVEDLHKYHKALDRALMRYHKMKVWCRSRACRV